jgi:very-short-patch-repair endonuclease
VGPYWLDLAYPGARLGIEYDGRLHLTPERARRDLVRQADLTRVGWDVLRFPAPTVLHHSYRIPAAVRAALARSPFSTS